MSDTEHFFITIDNEDIKYCETTEEQRQEPHALTSNVIRPDCEDCINLVSALSRYGLEQSLPEE